MGIEFRKEEASRLPKAEELGPVRFRAAKLIAGIWIFLSIVLSIPGGYILITLAQNSIDHNALFWGLGLGIVAITALLMLILFPSKNIVGVLIILAMCASGAFGCLSYSQAKLLPVTNTKCVDVVVEDFWISSGRPSRSWVNLKDKRSEKTFNGLQPKLAESVQLTKNESYSLILASTVLGQHAERISRETCLPRENP